MSQIGYMFLALGVAAWTGAVFHLATHALFKSLLFLAAGAIINALGHERDVFAMGGLAKKMPLLFWTFLVGAFGLTALPPVTAGLASKDAIIARLWYVGDDARILWWAAMAGVLLTSLYTFRMLFLVFAGESRGAAENGGSVGAPRRAPRCGAWRQGRERHRRRNRDTPHRPLAALPRRRPPRLPALPRRLAISSDPSWAARCLDLPMKAEAACRRLSSRWGLSSSLWREFP